MCYMEQEQAARAVTAAQLLRRARVGVRELRQNLSVSLESVIAVERSEATDQGIPRPR